MAYELDERFAHHMVDLDEVRLHYVKGGDGPPLVLLHGWGSTWYMWRRVLAKLADHYTVIAPDLRGLGDSGVPQKPISGYDKKTVARDIHQLVERLGLGSVHVVGHDHGAATAYAYAASYRSEVRSLVFTDMALMGVAGDEGIEHFMDHREELRLWHISFHAADHVAEMLIHGKEREYLRYMYRTQIYNVGAITDEDIDVYARSYAAPGGLRLELYRSFYQDGIDNREFAKNKLEIPVLAVGGSHSIRELCASSMRAVAEDVTGVVIPECGHWVPEERPQEFLDALIPFLEKATV
ncbi:MAG: alpha/beta fold hydrolase [Rhodococcus sp. (in: high G+C Gram-positive bacteria)]